MENVFRQVVKYVFLISALLYFSNFVYSQGPVASVLQSENPACYGDSTGSINIEVTDGVSPYTFLWSNNDTTQNIDTLAAGTYTVTVTDANFDTGTLTHEITQPDSLIIAVTYALNPSDEFLCDGAMAVTPAGGTSPYLFLWPDASTDSLHNNLCEGTYEITVTDSNLCAAIVKDSLYIQLQASLVSQTEATCNGNCDGTATVNAEWGVEPYSYIWSSGGTDTTETGLCAGDYTVTASDASTSSITIPITITEPNTLELQTTLTLPSSEGMCDGSIAVTPQGGTPPYNYMWPDATTDSLHIDLCEGTYIITVTDTNLCTAAIEDSLSFVLQMSISDQTDIDCYGICDGSATATPFAGVAPYTYLWSNGDTDSVMTGACAGSYKVTITDSDMATITDSVIIIQPIDTLVVNLISLIDPSIPDLCDGQIVVAASGGTGSYTYNWSGPIGDTLSDACDGAYTVTVSDDNLCADTLTIVLTDPVPTDFDVYVYSYQDPSCSQLSDGNIAISIAGGASPYTFLWSNDSTSMNLNNAPAGTYSVTVTDSNSGIGILTYTLSDPDSIIISTDSISNPSIPQACDGYVSLLVTGGTGSFSYDWSNGAVISLQNSLCAGIYHITVTDANMCSAIDSITLADPPMVDVFEISSDTASCNGTCDGSVTVGIAGGIPPYTFLWSNGQTDSVATGLCAGNYMLTVTDAAMFTDELSVTIYEPLPIQISTTITKPSCGNADGSIIVLPSDGISPYTYLWDANTGGQTNDTVINLAAAVYNVSITDDSLCMKEFEIYLSDDSAGVITLDTTNVTCYAACDGELSVVMTGGVAPYTYLWSQAQTDSSISYLCSGFYYVTVTDDSLCQTFAVGEVTQPDILIGNFSQYILPSCDGCCDGEAIYSLTGGTIPYTYQWTDQQVNDTATSLCEGISFITVTDNHSCTIIDSIDLTIPFGITIMEQIEPTCFDACNGYVAVNGIGGIAPYTFLWPDGSTDPEISGLCAGDYNLIVIDSLLDSVVVVVTITEPDQLDYSIVQHVDASLHGNCDGTVTVNAIGGTPSYLYQWSNGQTGETASNLCEGDISVTIIDAGYCYTMSNFIISEPAEPLDASVTKIDILCAGECTGVAGFIASGGNPPYSYLWSTGDTTATIDSLCVGDYQITIIDSDTIIINRDVTISAPDTLQLTVSSITDPAVGECNGEISVLANGGVGPYEYVWSNGGSDTIQSNLCMAVYYIEVTDEKLCTADALVTITDGVSTVSTIIVYNTVDCYGDCDGAVAAYLIGGPEPYSYEWSNSATDSNLTNICAGTYFVTITDSASIATIDSIVFAEPALLTLTIDSISDLTCAQCCDGYVNLIASGGTGSYNFGWSTGDTINNRSDLCMDTYSVTLSDSVGCQVDTSFFINDPYSIEVTVVDQINPVCESDCDGSFSIISMGGNPPYTYFWENGETDSTRTDLCAGMYFVTVTDIDSLSVIDTIKLVPNTIPVVILDTLNPVCLATNPFILTGGSPLGGQYSGTGVDSLGIFSPQVAGVGEFPITYSFTDTNGCVGTDTKIMYVDSLSSVLLVDLSNTCINSLPFIMTGGLPQGGYYTVNDTDTVSVFYPELYGLGTYGITYTADGSPGCLNYDKDSISVNSLPIVTFDTLESICQSTPPYMLEGGNPIGGTYSGFGTDTLNNFHAEWTALGMNELYYTYTDSNQCSNVDTQTIEITVGYELDFNTHSTVCVGSHSGSVVVEPVGGHEPFTYLWFNSETTDSIGDLASGMYSVTLTDSADCMSADSAQINDGSGLVIWAGYDQVICPGETTMLSDSSTLDTVNDLIYSWNPTDWLDDPDILTPLASPEDSMVYVLSASLDTSCFATDTVIISHHAVFGLDAGEDMIKYPLDDIRLEVLNPDTFMYFTWTPDEQLVGSNAYNPIVSSRNFPGPVNVTFLVTATTYQGCVEVDSVSVYMLDMAIPEGFTPNGDGVNDTWVLDYLQKYDEYTMQVFSRWGRLVFECHEGEEYWDGKYNGKELPTGTYYWVLTLEGSEYFIYPVTGSVTIFR